jgi:hypothetical protein
MNKRNKGTGRQENKKAGRQSQGRIEGKIHRSTEARRRKSQGRQKSRIDV